jgi:hypothetical protein
VTVTKFEKTCYIKGNEIRDKKTDDVIAILEIHNGSDGQGSYCLYFGVDPNDNTFEADSNIIEYNPKGHSSNKED